MKMLTAAIAAAALLCGCQSNSTGNPNPTRTKSYQLQLERLGGKAAVLFDEFNRWFAARWEGKALGVTIGCISAVVAGFLFWIASRTR